MSEPLTVVCVDDDLDVLQLLEASAREQEDFVVVGSATATGSVSELLRDHHPDVLVLDHGFTDVGPVIDLRERHRGNRTALGLQLVDLAHELVPDLTVVIFTGWDGLEIAAQNVGADLLVRKPDVDAIWAGVRKLRTAPAETEPQA